MKDKETPKRPKITDPTNKTILDSTSFLKHLKSRLILHENLQGQTKRLSSSFFLSLKGQKLLFSTFDASLSSYKGKPYSRDFIHVPWEGRFLYFQLSKLFQFSPLFVAPFLETLNQIAYAPVLFCYRETQDLSFFPKFSDYFAKSFPGSTISAGKLAVEKSTIYFKKALQIPLPSLSPSIEKGVELFNGKRWNTFKGSLLPLGYLDPEWSYGWLSSIPGRTLCNLNKNLKLTILSSLKSTLGISSMEVDLKSCHGKIFEDIFDWEGFPREDLPPLNDLWPNLISDFWDVTSNLTTFNEQRIWALGWSDTQLKAILKNQFYKALNGGLPDYADDNLARSAILLCLEKHELPIFSRFFHLILKNMKVFWLLTEFQKMLNASPLLYLPNQKDGYRTSTLSKKQEEKAKLNPEFYKPFKLTANSRLFTTMEFCLILHLLISIHNCNLPWLVVGYEADGVLVMGYFTEDEAKAGIELLNKEFRTSIKRLTTGDHLLDFKNFS